MRAISLLFFAMCLVVPAHAKVLWLDTESQCMMFKEVDAKRTCVNIVRSRELLTKTPLNYIADKGGTVVKKEFALAVAKPGDDRLDVVKLAMPFWSGESFQPEVLEGDFKVERLVGSGPYKLVFRVTRGGEEYTVYGGEHLWVPSEVAVNHGNRTVNILKRRAERMWYLPFQNGVYHEEFTEKGKHSLLGLVDQALQELRE